MSNYRFIMRTADSIVSNEDGRLVMQDKDERAKTEYASGDEEYAEGLLIIIKGLRVNRAGWKKLLIITGNVMKGERSIACPF